MEHKDRPKLAELIRISIEKYNSMTPEEKKNMYEAQRESWARGQAGLIEFDRESGYC